MTQDPFYYPIRLVAGFLLIVLLTMILAGCGSLLRLEYENPQYGGAAVEFTLPQKGGYAK